MNNGLNITKEQFQSLNQKEKLDVLFDNQVVTIRMIGGYRFYQKLILGWLAGITTIGSYLASKFIEGK